MRVGYFDCFSGTAGDMTLAALVDAGVDRRAIQQGVASLGLPCEITFENVRRGGFRATYCKVLAPEEHVHRHWHHIETLIDKGGMSPRQKDLAKRIFLKLGEAEASVHGVDLSKIHFHEVGALDSIADICGSAIGLDLLGVDRYEASPVPTGRGWVKAAHGRMPLPAPATAELLRGVPLAESQVEGEMTTPTGAAILATVVERFAPFPALTIESIGIGAGTRETAGQANILRLFVGTVDLPASADRVWVLETNLDDLPGEIVGYTMTKLMDSGALDAFVTPIQMKKNRPGVMVSVLCGESEIAALEAVLFRETATLGIRRYAVSRHKLKRQAHDVQTSYGPVRGKLGWLDNRVPAFSPEFDECARIAAAQSVPLREVYEAAQLAYSLESKKPSE